MDDLIWAIKKALATRAHLGVIRFLIDVKKNFFETSMHHLVISCHFKRYKLLFLININEEASFKSADEAMDLLK